MNKDQLAAYNMTAEELAEWNSLVDQIYQDCAKAGVPKQYVDPRVTPYDFENNRGYCKELGYYDVYTERGCNNIRFLGSKADMRFYLLKEILFGFGTQTELQNRAKLTTEWTYHTKYDSRKFWFEYKINKIYEILGQDYSVQLIREHTSHMNRWFPDKHWEFDQSERKFVETSNSEEIE
ncbi:MAG: hypothetical protein IJZ61_02695 [Oscillospiraceae bacterium]|nr:hypothetical protein [Oscillospiraceae bacterium]